ncbi:autotransporter-associated beta strand repeat-containing protein, partial [Helicobacter sp. 10-6591]|uniref:autotransporter-associated beta strand repeat-containing protein n=1 Tax=Helicobacter sp. 10-6591 TaxID=2004998 RepID=UPI000DCC20F6
PFVSGAAALVQEKFPDLNGRQIADVLLSTANKNVVLPKVILKTFTDKNKTQKHTIIITSNSDVSRGLVIKNKDEVLNALKDAGYDSNVDSIYNDIIKTPDNKLSIYELNKESIIGQGVLDIQKAMGGLARLDANRLTRDDIYTLNSNSTLTKWNFTIGSKFTNTEHALYTLNVSDSNEMLFSNNIDERLWDTSLHYNIGGTMVNLASSPSTVTNPMTHFTSVGLLKHGTGTLVLSGQNTYTGLTYVANGTLALMSEADYYNEKKYKNEEKHKAQTTSAAMTLATAANNSAIPPIYIPNNTNAKKPSLSGSVYVTSGATLAGNGTIKQNLDNHGTVQAGTLYPTDTSGKDDKTGTNNDLIVGGTYTQDTDATLTLVFGESGNAKLNATNGYNIANGAKLTFTPQKNVFFTLAGNKISIDMGNMPKHNFKISKPISDGSLQFDIDVFS